MLVAHLGASRIVSASLDCSLRLWDFSTGACLTVFNGHRGPVNHVAALGGDRIASASDDGAVRIWSLRDGCCLRELSGHQGAVTCVAPAADHLIASCGQDRSVRLWDVDSGACVATLWDHNGPVAGVLPLPDDRLLSWSFDWTVRLWSIPAGKCLKILRDHDGPVTAAVLAGEFVASASQDNTIRLWDAASGEPRGVLQGHRSWVGAVAVTSDGRVVSGSRDHALRIWDAGVAASTPLEDLSSIVPEIVQSRALVQVVVRDASTAISMTADPDQWQLWSLEDGTCQQVAPAGSSLGEELSESFYEAIQRRVESGGIHCGSAQPSETLWGLLLQAVSAGPREPVEGIGCLWSRLRADGLWEHMVQSMAIYPLDCRLWASVYGMDRTIAFDRTTKEAHIVRLHRPGARS